jgi:hypothetical protein
MTQHADQLRRAFESHEHLAPDPAVVFARSQELARSYRRRRVGAQAAGGAVLGASLVAGGVRLPALLPERQGTPVVVQPAASTTPTTASATPATANTSPAAAAPESQLNREREAFFAAGYDLADAEKLAALWKMSARPNDLSAVKAEAGRRLLAGETLPVKPNPAAVADAKDTHAVSAFFAAGYDYQDAQKLAALWKISDTYQVKIIAGEKLLAGGTLPVAASPAAVEATKESRAISAFLEAGYGYADAQELATLWKSADATAAKVTAGEKLLAGESLPIAPSPASVADAKKAQAVGAFFDAGYVYEDAVQLATLWKTADAYGAKVMAGEKLIAGETLPIAP